MWLGDSTPLHILLDIYALTQKLEHVWIILPIGKSFNVARANIRKNELRKQRYSPSLKTSGEEDSRDSKLFSKKTHNAWVSQISA